MHLISQGLLRVASLTWQPRAGMWTLTVVCKATFDLRPGDAPLAVEQDVPNDDDNHWDDDPARSLFSPADVVPFKPRADIVLVGSAYAPHGQPARALAVRIQIGAVDKTVDVHGDRGFGPDGQAREAPPFVKMRMRYERAAGGPDTHNPVGVRLDGLTRGALPNLLPPGSVLARRGDRVAPTGFGPIAGTWPERRARLGRHAGTWPFPGWTERPMPEDIDPGYLNVAPRDQRLPAIRDDERITLDNLHPDHPRLVTALPGLHPRAFVERRSAPASELPMTADTLWIDTDRGVCTVTWRGQIQLVDRHESGRVTVTVDRPAPRAADVPTMFLPQTPITEIEEISVDEEAPTGEQGSAA